MVIEIIFKLLSIFVFILLAILKPKYVHVLLTIEKMKEANNRLDLCRLIPIVKLSKLTEKANKIGLI